MLLGLLSASLAAGQDSGGADPIEDARLAIRTRQFDHAVQLLQAGARNGSPEAQYLLGLAAWNGIGLAPDGQHARELLARSAEQGHARAAYALAALLAHNGGAHDREAREWLDRAAVAGYAPAVTARRSGTLPLADPRAAAALGVDLRFDVARFAAGQNDLKLLRAVRGEALADRRDDFGRTLLFSAAQSGATDVVVELLNAGYAADAADHFGITPLMLAVRQREEGVTAALLAAGARPGVADKAGRGAMFHAASADQAGQVRRLLAAGAPIDARDVRGANATDIARRHDSQAALDALQAAGGRPTLAPRARSNAIDVTRGGRLYRNWPPLLVAAVRNEVGELRRRVAAGEDLAGLAPGGESALQVAIEARAVKAVEALLELGADPRRRGTDGRSAVERIALGGGSELNRVLIERGMLDGDELVGLLVSAIERGDLPLVRALLARGASVRQRDSSGLRPLHRAARQGQVEMLELLLDRGAVITDTDARGRGSLWHAVAARRLVAVERLLAMRAPFDEPDEAGETPLAVAIRNSDGAVVRHLLDAGARVDGSTPALRIAAEQGDEAMVAALLARGADLDGTDSFGETALIAAARAGHERLCAQLLKAGANPRLRGRDRATAAEIAEARGFVQLAQRLRQ